MWQANTPVHHEEKATKQIRANSLYHSSFHTHTLLFTAEHLGQELEKLLGTKSDIKYNKEFREKEFCEYLKKREGKPSYLDFFVLTYDPKLD